MDLKSNQKFLNDQNILNRFLNTKSATKEERNFQTNINSSSISIKSDINIGDKEVNRQTINNNFSSSLRSTIKKPEPDPIVSEIQVPVRLKSGDKEDWIRDLKITLIATFTSSNKMNINLNLTDELDPLFLYSIDIGESEFHSIKTEQSLLIDFQQFPQKLFEMLEMCHIKNDDYVNNNNYIKNNIGSSNSFSMFNAILLFTNINEASLVIQECNQFRQLNHLIIRVRQATDHHLKNYLSSIVKELKDKSENLLKDNNRLKEQSEITNVNFKQLGDDFFSIKEKHNLEILSIKNENQKEINNIRERLVVEYQGLLDNKEKDKNSEIRSLTEKLNKTKDEKDKLLEDFRQLEDLKKSLEISLRETTSQSEISKKDLIFYKEELSTLRNQNKNLDQTKFSQEKHITEYTIKLELLTKQLEEKESSLKNLKLMVDSMQGQKNENDDLIKSLKNNNSKLEEKLGHSIAEINKGNEIIKKLQNDVKTQKKLTKSKVQMITQTEQFINQKQNQVEDISRQINDTKKENEKKDEEIKSVKLENENLKLKLEESQKIIESNNQVIKFLNQKCNENYVPYNNFSNMLNFNSSNANSAIGTGNSIKTIFPESNNLTEKYQFNTNNFNEIQSKSNNVLNEKFQSNTNNYNEIQSKSNLLNNFNPNYKTSNAFSNTNNFKENQQTSSDNFIKPLTNFTSKLKDGTLNSNINTNFFENNKIGNYNPTSIETNTFSGTQNLTNYKYGGGNQEKYTNKGTSLISQKYGNSVKITDYLNNNDLMNSSGKEKDSKFDDEEEQPRSYVSLGAGIKNNKK